MKVIIRGCQTYGSNAYSLDVEKIDQISTVKRKISNKTGIDCKHQGLIFNGKQLEEVRSLLDYEIQHESTLHLICRQCGC